MIVTMIASVGGFAAYLALDLPRVLHARGLRLGLILGGSAALALSWYGALGQGASLGFPAAMRGWGWLLSIGAALLLLYSVFLEIPLQQRAEGAGESALVQSGTYALCRHPGFWWLLLFMLGQVGVTNRTGLLGLTALWTALNLILVTVQDVLLFPHRFPAYAAYRRTTPFLIPTLASLKQCMLTFIRGL